MNEQDAFWAAHFGLSTEEFGQGGLHVRAHVGLAGYQGIWSFRRGSCHVVSLPPAWLAPLAPKLGELGPDGLLDPGLWQDLLGAEVDYIYGPMLHAALDPAQFRPAPAATVRFLNSEDAAAVEAFRKVCGTAFEKLPQVIAHFEGDTITALAAYRPINDFAGDPCILTHPAHRGRGCATLATSALVAWALEQKKLLLYETDEANVPSVKLAARLGFTPYARHLTIGLKTPAPPGSEAPR